MTRGGNLSLRLTGLLLIGFVLLQLVVLALTALPTPDGDAEPYNLPPPAQVAALADALDQAPAARRTALMAAFEGALYHLRIASAPGVANAADPRQVVLAARYRANLPGRTVWLSGGPQLLRRFADYSPWQGRLLAPVTLTVTLHSGGVLVIDSRPAPLVRTLMRQRALRGALGGLVVLAVLVFAVRQTMRPLVRLAAGIRQFALRLDAPDLPITGSVELRELSSAYNDMKARIAGLIEERTRVLASIAHDMRTYLTRLRLRAEFIDDPDQRIRAARDLDEMALLLDDTLLFAQADASARPPSERIDLGAEIAALVALRHELGEPVGFTPPESAIPAQVSRIALRRMLGNLIDNGLRHGAAVTIALAAGPAGPEVVVADTGPGVAPEALDLLGTPFGRLDPSRDRATGGAGLGLAIVVALAEQCGARVRFRNGASAGLEVRLAFRTGSIAPQTETV